jgi:hypothetical protein
MVKDGGPFLEANAYVPAGTVQVLKALGSKGLTRMGSVEPLRRPHGPESGHALH